MPSTAKAHKITLHMSKVMELPQDEPSFVERTGPDSCLLKLWIQPKARVSEFVGIYQDRLKIRLAAPPVDDKANKELCRFLCVRLQCRQNQVRLVQGHASRKKVVSMRGIHPSLIERLVAETVCNPCAKGGAHGSI